MNTGEPENLLTEWSTLLMESLADAGITDVVSSPGSRNTPFVLAASRCTRLRVVDVIDERAAAFYALGQARVTGRPSALLCTSGSAGAHYLPAVVEAAESRTPLVIVTADRPFELQACGAAQTIDQIKLFGGYARAFFELGMPDASPGALRALRRMAAQAVSATAWPLPGAVHINARARKPLEPRAADSSAGRELAERSRALRARPIARVAPPHLVPDPAAVAEIAAAIRAGRRGLVVCGPMGIGAGGALAAADALAAVAGYPVLAEASSQVRFGDGTATAVHADGFDVFLRSRELREGARPDLVVQLGGTPTSTAWRNFHGQHADVPRVVVSEHGFNDPQSGETLHLVAEPVTGAEAIAAALSDGTPGRSAWGELFSAANQAAWRAVHDVLGAAGDRLGEGRVAREVVRALPAGSFLALGNSMPIRLVDTFCEQGLARARVLVQRGANGIDGLVAGAAGSASVAGAPLTLLLGDVSLLHDLSSLALVARAPVPVVVVAIQNQGGRIFEHLPIAGAPGVDPSHVEHLTTPHAFGFEHAARTFGLRYARVDGAAALQEVLAGAYDAPGATLVEAVVPPSDSAEQHRRIWSACTAATADLAARAKGA